MGSPQTRQLGARPARRGSQRPTRTSSNVSLRPAAAGLSELTSVSAEGRRTGRRRAGASKAKSEVSAGGGRGVEVKIELQWGGGHVTLLKSPTTLPRTRTSFDRMGSIVSFSG